MTTRLTIEYDGSDFSGWASQPDGARTVQSELERALAIVLRRPLDGDDPPRLTVAGRTDRGVHAWAQVASYEGEPALAAALNGVLAHDVSILASEAAADGFDARRDCSSRAYCFRVLARAAPPVLDRRRAVHLKHPVGEPELEALHACAALLRGSHDFTAFTPVDSYHVRFDREVYSAYWKVLPLGGVPADASGREEHGDGLLLEFWIEADTFMRHMNRILVGTMLDVVRGRLSVERFAALLEGAPRTETGVTASPAGLYFAGAGYGGRRVIPSSIASAAADARTSGPKQHLDI
jgi:tRNA pseudouridine38-40 synthase